MNRRQPNEARRVVVRRFRADDTGQVWALNLIPHRGLTADRSVPLNLPIPPRPPEDFPDLADVDATFIGVGGDFVVAELDGRIVGMGGIRANERGQAEVLRIRVHPAMRRLGVGAAVMTELENRARALGFLEMHLDTATNQPEAIAFYDGMGCQRVGRESRPEWEWTLIYFTKRVDDDPSSAVRRDE